MTVVAGGRERHETLVPRCGYLGQGDPRLHFGLGDTATVERIEVSWPDGTKQEFADLAADRVYVVRQGEPIQ